MELVEVEGGNEWKIRKLAEKYDNICWKFACSSSIIQFELGELKHPSSQLPTFHCKVVQMDTPFNLSIQPKSLDRARRNMTELLNQTYNENEKSYIFEDCQFVEGIACCVQIRDQWYRATLQELTKSEICYVRLADFGDMKMVQKGQLRTLLPRFGRIPPMALTCSVKGILIQEMDSHKVQEFQRILESLNFHVRCQILSESQPFLINLLHPTITGKNLCEHILTKRQLIEPVRQMYDENENSEGNSTRQEKYLDDDYDSYDDDDQESEEEETELYIKEFPRANKAIRFITKNFTVCQVENANLIYLTNQMMNENREKIEKSLKLKWDNLPSYPISWFIAGNSCATKDYQRATIVETKENRYADLFLIDHGKFLKNVSISEVRPAPADDDILQLPPQIVAVSLYSMFRLHFGAINILQQILTIGSNVEFNAYSKSKNIPNRGHILIDGMDLEQMYIATLKSMRINPNCQDLMIYKPKVGECNVDYVYNLTPPRCFTKSNFNIEKYP